MSDKGAAQTGPFPAPGQLPGVAFFSGAGGAVTWCPALGPRPRPPGYLSHLEPA